MESEKKLYYPLGDKIYSIDELRDKLYENYEYLTLERRKLTGRASKKDYQYMTAINHTLNTISLIGRDKEKEREIKLRIKNTK